MWFPSLWATQRCRRRPTGLITRGKAGRRCSKSGKSFSARAGIASRYWASTPDPGAQKFNTRYATFGFMHEAHLDEGAMWPTAFALRCGKGDGANYSHISLLPSLSLHLPDFLTRGFAVFPGISRAWRISRPPRRALIPSAPRFPGFRAIGRNKIAESAAFSSADE